MIIPLGYAHVVHRFGGTGLPRGAALTHGIKLEGTQFLETRAANIATLFEDTLLVGMVQTVTYLGCLVKAGPNTTGPMAEVVRSEAGSGIDAGAPPNVSYLVRKRTALGGRTNRGRFYWPGVAETTVDPNGTIQPGTLTAQQARLEAYLSGLATAESPMYLLHNASSDPTEVIQLQIDTKVATQRRRLR